MNVRAIFIRIFASRGRVEFKRRLVPSSVGSSKSQTNEPACHAGWKKWWDLRGYTYYITIVIYIYMYIYMIISKGSQGIEMIEIVIYIYIIYIYIILYIYSLNGIIQATYDLGLEIWWHTVIPLKLAILSRWQATTKFRVASYRCSQVDMLSFSLKSAPAWRWCQTLLDWILLCLSSVCPYRYYSK